MNINIILKDAFLEGIQKLKSAGIDAPALEAGVLLCHVLRVDRSFLFSHNDYRMTSKEYENFIFFTKQRVEGKPLQYITQHQEFMALNFHVTPDVLIPRQDTEILVEAVLDYAKRFGKNQISILDIGTGSGCIAVSLAVYIKCCKVTALDISQKALDIAKDNAKRHEVDRCIDFIRADIFDTLDGVFYRDTKAQGSFEGFDIIVSNPPYIPTGEIRGLDMQVKDYEPHLALNGGEDGLDFYEGLTKEAAILLKPNSLFAVEVGYNQSKSVVKFMKNNFKDIGILKDLAGIERVVMGFKI